MSLHDYAEDELRRAGLFDEDSDYGGMLGTAVLELIDAFAAQGHSGFSAGMTIQIFSTLAGYKPITPLTYAEDEWNEVGTDVWQNRRKSTVFSNDLGATWYDLDEEPRVIHVRGGS